jgi:hypothetical protein
MEAVAPEQEAHRQREAQELLNRLKSLLIEGDTTSVELLSDALEKAEQLCYESAMRTDNLDTRKTLQDISALMLSARQVGRNKNVADRLQRIAEESQKALDAVSKVGLTIDAASTTKQMLDWTYHFRPLFYLIVGSREFRQLMVDSVTIAKQVIGRYTKETTLKEDTKQKFLEGESTSEIAKDVKERVKEQGAPQMTDEEVNALLDDVQRVLAILAREPSYREGIERIFIMLDLFQQHLASEQPITTLPQDIHMQRVVTETEALVADFSGRDTLERFKFNLRRVILEIKQHEDLQHYLHELQHFIISAKSEEEVRSEDFKQRSKDLANRGRELFYQLRDQLDLDPLFDSTNELFENIKNDEFLQVLAHHAGVVQADLSYTDNEGKTQMATDMITNLQTVLIPIVADALKYIPLPRIESYNEDREFWLDNIVLCSYDILPENIRFHLESDAEISLRDIETKEARTFLVISLNKILTELKNVSFWYSKKTIPVITDSGLVTFRIIGNGARLRLTYNVVQGPEDKFPRVVKGKADFDISDMEIEFDKTTIKHDILLPMITQMFKLQIKAQMECAVEKNLNGFLEKLGNLMTETIGTMNRPFLSGLEFARKAVKSTQFAQVYEGRHQKLE